MDNFDLEDLTIYNQSKGSIFCTLSTNNVMFDYEKFLTKERINKGEKLSSIDLSNFYLSDEILPNTSKDIFRPPVWKDYINKCKEKKIHLFIISKDSVDKYGWEYIHKNNIYNKKYLLDIEVMNAMNWKLYYK